MSDQACCLTCSMFQLLLDHYPEGYDPATGSDIMESLAKVAGFLLKNADDRFLDLFAAQVRYERAVLREEDGLPAATHNSAGVPASPRVLNS